LKKATANLESIVAAIRDIFNARDRAREQALPLCREVIRHAGLCIRAVHRHEFEKASGLLDRAGDTLEQIASDDRVLRELANSNFIRDAQKEYAEAAITLALTRGHELPEPAGLGIDPAPYLNGMAEAASEMRRYLLDSIRGGDLSRCEDILAAMDDIYGTLVTIDFPDAITGGLRRTTDQLRGVLERTRGDLTLIMQQQKLEAKLAAEPPNKEKGA